MALSIGVIGLGNRMRGVLGTLNARGEDAHVTCVADPDPQARERLQESGIPWDGARFYPDVEELLKNERPDGLMIGTRCNLHAQLAARVMERGVPLFLEKPVFMNEAGYQALRAARECQRAPVVVSFPLRMTALALAARDIVRQGTLGPISQVIGQTTVNYARGYYKKWYRDGAITGGMFLQKATHDLDLIFYLTDTKPLSLCAMESRAVFGGEMPAGISCDQCEKRKTCPESDWALAHVSHEPAQPLTCSFGRDVTIQDAGSVLVRLSNGAHAAYAQCFAARKQANRRATRIVGLKATLDLDFATGRVQVFHHEVDRVDTYAFGTGGGHFGGDDGLMAAFTRVLRGEEGEYPTLDDGITSALTCLRAQQFAERGNFLNCQE